MRRKLFIVFIFLFSVFLTSCASKEPKLTFEDYYDYKITQTLKIGEETYRYQYVYDYKIQIKPKSDYELPKSFIVKLSIYDGTADAFSEEIITRYFSVDANSNIDETISNVYTNNILLSSEETTLVDSAGVNYTKDFALDITSVSFQAFYGTSPSSITVRINQTYGELPILTRTGYEFLGWYENSNFTGEEITSSSYVTNGNDHTLYAKWDEISYTVTLVYNDGISSNSTIGVNYNSTYEALPEPVRTGYEFLGWYENSNFTGEEVTSSSLVTVANNHILYAKWEAISYAVTLVYNDGISSNSTIDFNYNSTYETLPVPVRTGYEFLGWYVNGNFTGEEITSSSYVTNANDHTLYAKWVITTYNISYYDEYSENPNPTTYTINQSTIFLQDLSRTGYAFEGWYTSTDYLVQVNQISLGSYGDKELHAKWIPNQFEVTLQYNDDTTQDATILVTFDDYYYLNEPIRDGYLFEGWYYFDGETEWLCYFPLVLGYSEEELMTVSTPYDHILYAKWTEGTKGLVYTLKENGSDLYWEITGYEGSSTDVFIPNKYFDIPVTSIGTKAFSNLSSITSISISESITTIGYRAFENCIGLKNIVIPDTITIFELRNGNYSSLWYEAGGNYSEMFFGCTSIESITIAIPLGNSELQSENNMILDLFNHSSLSPSVPSSLKTIIITSGNSISNSLLYQVTSLTSLVLPNTVTSIVWDAFKDSVNVELYLNISSKPIEWASNWNYYNRLVHWSGSWEFIDGVPTPNVYI